MSGIVMTADSLSQRIPNANIIIKKRNKGTTSDVEGFFSFAALPGDTLQFSAIGFKKEYLKIPDTLAQKEYLARIVMRRDTTVLQEVTLYPWPTPDKLNDAVLASRAPATENDIAMRNLAVQALRERAAEMGYSPEEMQDYVISAQNADIYNFGRYQGFQNGGSAVLGSLTNPFAWAEFFEAIKKGEFSKTTPRKRQ